MFFFPGFDLISFLYAGSHFCSSISALQGAGGSYGTSNFASGLPDFGTYESVADLDNELFDSEKASTEPATASQTPTSALEPAPAAVDGQVSVSVADAIVGIVAEAPETTAAVAADAAMLELKKMAIFVFVLILVFVFTFA